MRLFEHADQILDNLVVYAQRKTLQAVNGASDSADVCGLYASLIWCDSLTPSKPQCAWISFHAIRQPADLCEILYSLIAIRPTQVDWVS